ncbi:hypothetical protein [Rhodoluna sp. KAS3]|uniref:hypothetical protein n=1 Tax=Rhodoluna sp. KAS3 TaxID=942880 RepID=UPI00222F63F0|nr:hypothetical protein [Rhodoluna sp. KAS3]
MKSTRARKPSNHKIKLLAAAVAFALMAYGAIIWSQQAAGNTQQYLVAIKGLPAGAQVSSEDFTVVEYQLGSTGEHYLAPDQLSRGSYTLGPIRAGQLVAKSYLANAVIDARVPVVVTSAMGLPESMQPGSSADIWVTPQLADKSFGEPYLLVLAAEVARLAEPSAVFADAPPEVELWVPAEAVPAVLKAQSGGSELSLVMRATFAD